MTTTAIILFLASVIYIGASSSEFDVRRLGHDDTIALSTSQPPECHLQVECTAHNNNSVTSRMGGGAVKKIRIPVRAARGPPGPTGLRGPAGPRGPPGYSPVINDEAIARGRAKRAAHRPRLPHFFYPPELKHHPNTISTTSTDINPKPPTPTDAIVWSLEEQDGLEDIHILELRVGPNGFSDRLATLEGFADSCSIHLSGAGGRNASTQSHHFCFSVDSLIPDLISASVGIVIDWSGIEGTTADAIWEAFQRRLVDETIFRPVAAAFTSQYRSPEALAAWQRGLTDNTLRKSSYELDSGNGNNAQTDESLAVFLAALVMLVAC